MPNTKQFEIMSDIPVPPKIRTPKHFWDSEVIEEVTDLRTQNPSQSLRSTIYEILSETLTPNEMPDIQTHYQRICERMKRTN